jgi:hypothetical protein
MMMNLGLLLLFVIVFAYVLIPPIFTQGSYLEAVRTRYRKILGGEWTLRRQLIFEAGAALIVICLVLLLTYLTLR